MLVYMGKRCAMFARSRSQPRGSNIHMYTHTQTPAYKTHIYIICIVYTVYSYIQNMCIYDDGTLFQCWCIFYFMIV